MSFIPSNPRRRKGILFLVGWLGSVGGAAAADHRTTRAVPSPVSENTMSVAVLPRPPVVRPRPQRRCPHGNENLAPWDPAWIGARGTIDIPRGVRALVRGNLDIPEDLLISRFSIPRGSELVFDDQPTTIRVTDLRVGGTLRLGSPLCRLRSRIEFIFDTRERLDREIVLERIHGRAGLGLVVEPRGRLEVFGALHQPTWTRLASTASNGSATLELAEPVSWRPGQQVVVVTSERRDYPFTDQNEVRGIHTAPRGGGPLILDQPLNYTHYGGPEYQVEVGLLSRNIVFRTADRVLSRVPGFGGHIMVDRGRARVSGVELRGLGQRNFLGRYPMHFHRLGDARQRSFLTDSSIVDSNWRCAVIHRTDNVTVARNVAFNTWGHCFYLEDGVEQGNDISFNLAAGIKILGPVDEASLQELWMAGQEGFTLRQSADMVNPADRAAAGFYIPNGNNRIVGNASSGGFAGYSFPLLPEPLGGSDEGLVPAQVPVSGFDGNTAHSAAYFWPDSGCVYAGGVLELVDVDGTEQLEYRSGRAFSPYLRTAEDLFANTKTFLCEFGLTHWGWNPRVVNFEAWDNAFLVQLFGTATIESAISAGKTGHTPDIAFRPLNYHQRGFRFYDTDTLTLMRGVLFRGFEDDPMAGERRSQNNCAMMTLTHSDQFTPQRMTATAEFYFADVDPKVRFCNDDRGTLSSRNFNLNDTDGSATRLDGDGIADGPRLVGSGYTDSWRLSDECSWNVDWGLWVCPEPRGRNVAAVATLPNQGVDVVISELDGTEMGRNAYSSTASYSDAQITGPSGTRWHHTFPRGFPRTFEVHALQVPEESFVLYSFDLPSLTPCSIAEEGWQELINLRDVLASNVPSYATERGVCYVRIPPASQGTFEGAGLSLPYQTQPGYSPASSFTIRTR